MKITPYKERTLDYRKPVHVYRNLGGVSRASYSVRQGGLVVGHCWQLYLKNCEFKVSEAGRKRVLKEKRKNVHAYVKGFVIPPNKAKELMPAWQAYSWKILRYNPYICGDFFIRHKDGEDSPGDEVKEAAVVFLGKTTEALGAK